MADNFLCCFEPTLRSNLYFRSYKLLPTYSKSSQVKSTSIFVPNFPLFTFLKITCTWCSWLLRNEGKQHAGSTFHDTNGIYVYVNSKDHRALWRPTSRSILIALQYNLSLPCSNSVKVVWLKQRPLDASMTRQVQFSSREELFTLCYK